MNHDDHDDEPFRALLAAWALAPDLDPEDDAERVQQALAGRSYRIEDHARAVAAARAGRTSELDALDLTPGNGPDDYDGLRAQLAAILDVPVSWLQRRQFTVTVHQVQIHNNIRHDVRAFVAAHPLPAPSDDLEVGRRRQRVRDICRGPVAWEAWDRLNSFHSVMAWQAADDDTAELVEVYAEGYTGEGAARAAGLDQARHHAAMVQLARAVAACDSRARPSPRNRGGAPPIGQVMNKPKDAPILRLVRPDEGGPDPDDPDETDVRFLDAVTDDLQDLIVRTTVPLDELFPEDDTLENAIRIARLTAFARALVDGAPLPPRPPRPSPPPRPAPTMSTRLRLALFRSMLKHLAGDGHPDVTALVDAYDRGLAGEEAAAAAGLEPVRRDRAIVGVKRLVDDCDRLLDEPAQLH